MAKATEERKEKMTPFLTRPIAHRGLHDKKESVPENSKEAFRRAVEKSYAIEVDVRLSRDGIPVAFHDGSLKRLSGQKGRLKRQTFESLSQTTLSGTDQTVPSLKEVLAIANGVVPVIVEIKNWSIIDRRLERAIKKELEKYTGATSIMSFNPLVLWWWKRKMPEIPRGLVVGRNKESISLGWVGRKLATMYAAVAAKICGADFFALSEALAISTKRHHAKNRRPVRLVWAVATEEDGLIAQETADNIIFEQYHPE